MYGMMKPLKVKWDEPERRGFLSLNTIWGMNIIRSPHVPKRKIPITPRTDDMREMCEALTASGAASPQFKEVDQVLMVNGSMACSPEVYRVLSNIT